MLLLLILVSPASAAQIPKADTLKQALANLREAFPDWNENYQEGEFDCSEMSSFVGEYLYSCGLEPTLRLGYTDDSAHAWVVCQGKYIECTSLKISKAKAYSQYKPYRYPFIISMDEFDWWNSDYIKSKGVTI